VFEDWPGHYRPAHINACSTSEMRHVLMAAWREGWSSFVIVTHSFELLNQRRTGPDPIVVRRFDGLCRFLNENRDKFRTTTFAACDARSIAAAGTRTPLRSNVIRTGRRVLEQTLRRWRW
jgi:hypothetical protein